MSFEHASSQVARLLDQLRGSNTIPNGTRKAIADAVDTLRYAGAPDELVSAAGDVAASIHRWELALCLGNADNLKAARLRADETGDRWTAAASRWAA